MSGSHEISKCTFSIFFFFNLKQTKAYSRCDYFKNAFLSALIKTIIKKQKKYTNFHYQTNLRSSEEITPSAVSRGGLASPNK